MPSSQLGRVLALATGQVLLVLLDVGAGHPVPQVRLADPRSCRLRLDVELRLIPDHSQLTSDEHAGLRDRLEPGDDRSPRRQCGSVDGFRPGSGAGPPMSYRRPVDNSRLAGWQRYTAPQHRLPPHQPPRQPDRAPLCSLTGGATWMSSMNWSLLSCPAGARSVSGRSTSAGFGRRLMTTI
jgi:hypothetical protein